MMDLQGFIIVWGAGRILNEIWQKFGRNLAEIWQKFGRNLAEIWQKFEVL